MARWYVVLVCCVALVGCSGGGNSPDVSTPGSSPSVAQSDRQTQSVEGLVDVGAHELYLKCEGSGSPTVVFEAGLTGDYQTWLEILPEIAKKTRVCAYNRANIAPSGSAPTPRTAADMVADLHALMEAAGETPPFVLVGFSFGGLVSQLYARTHPNDVSGLVLVESNHPDEVDQFEKHLTPAQIARDHRETDANSEGVDVYRSFEQVQAAPPLRDLPVVVVTGGVPLQWPPGWDEDVFNRLRAAQQKDLAASVTDGTQLIARSSGHEVPSTQPEVIVKGVLLVLAKLE